MTTLRQIFKKGFTTPPEIIPMEFADAEIVQASEDEDAQLSSPSRLFSDPAGKPLIFSGSLGNGAIAGIAAQVGAVGMGQNILSQLIQKIDEEQGTQQIHKDVKSEYLVRIDNILKRINAVDKGSEKRDQVQEIRRKYIGTGVLTKDDMKFLNEVYRLLTVTNQLLKESR